MRTTSWPGTLVEPYCPMEESLPPLLSSQSGFSLEVPDPIEQCLPATGKEHRTGQKSLLQLEAGVEQAHFKLACPVTVGRSTLCASESPCCERGW